MGNNGVRFTSLRGVLEILLFAVSGVCLEKYTEDYLVALLAKTGGKFRFSFKQPTKRRVADRFST